MRTTMTEVLTGRRRTFAALTVTMVLCGVTAPSAMALKPADEDAYPTQAQVDAAEAKVARRAQSVGTIKAELALANQRLEQAAVAAEQAAEAYNGARWQLEVATDRLKETRDKAGQARATVAGQRDDIASLVTSSYMSGGGLEALHAFVGNDGPEAVMDKYLAYEGATSSMEASYQRFQASATLAEVFERQAEEARSAQVDAAREAKKARDHAAAAAESAQRISDEVAAQKQVLIRRLARAQGISVELAQERQDALAVIAAERAAEKAAQEAAAKQAAEEAAALQAAEEAASEEKKEQEPKEESDPSPPADPPPPATDPPPPPSGGAGTAIEFAKDQLGEPYQWGADGPDAWDCSGLTMRAWATAGVSLPHYSAAQYSAGTPISVGQLRPGDLVFWGSSPSSIHHVAMYIGGGQIIHAPRTGRPVAIDSMYYWVPPNYFTRP